MFKFNFVVAKLRRDQKRLITFDVLLIFYLAEIFEYRNYSNLTRR